MAYLVNSTRVASLTINGTDYTANLTDWTCSDSSAYKNGLISTTGTLSLSTRPGTSLEDYDRNAFKRGQEIILDVTYPDGTTSRHPRGLLYVIGTSYDPSSESIEVEMGCRIALAALTDQTDALAALSTLVLDPARKNDYQNIASALAAEGKAAYQDNQGNLTVVSFFGGDSDNQIDAGDWVSVLGETTLTVSPLAGTAPLPDEIRLSYQVPAGAIVDEDDQGDQDSPNKTQYDEVESYYFITYPAVIYTRTGDGSLPGGITDGSTPSPTDSGCGNSPTQPGDNGQGSCSDNYTLSQDSVVVPAFKRQVSETRYQGQGGQVSYRYSEVRGPAIEANQQYYADLYAYCRYTWATNCQPNGGCPMEGLDEILLGYTEQTNSYGPAGQLLSTVTDTYIPTLAAAQPFNWRSGVVNGAPQNFTELSTTDMFRSQRRVEEYTQENSTNITTTTVYTSSTASQTGINSGNIDALAGQVTREIRRSTTITGNSVLPDTINTVETATAEKESIVKVFGTPYITPPPEAGPYFLEENVPVPVLYDDENQIEGFVQNYSRTLTAFVKGDALGLQVGESLRKEISETWQPGQPFRYCDTYKGVISAMRMDATTWNVTADESTLVTTGIWIGFSNGVLVPGGNLSGNSTPSMGQGGVTPPPAAAGPPSISGEAEVAVGARGWEVDVFFYTDAATFTYGEGVRAPLPTGDDASINHSSTFMCYVKGILTEAGSLTSPDGNGGVPAALRGSLLLTNAVVVDGDLFS